MLNKQLKYVLVLLSTCGLIKIQAQEEAIVRADSIKTEGLKMQGEHQLPDNQNTVTDIDSNIYPVVTIGQQTWMGENLRTTRYNDGTPIPPETDNAAWRKLESPAYCWYNNDEATYKNPFGALYNFFTVNTAKLCPTGWHVPSNNEWTTLFTFLGGTGVSRIKLKEIGFNPILGGGRLVHSNSEGGYFEAIEQRGGWWSSNGFIQNMSIDHDGVNRQESNWILQRWGFSVRCVKDFDEETSVPVVTSVIVTPISHSAANAIGNVLFDGGTAVTDRGVCWSTSQNPTIKDKNISSGGGSGEYVSSITGLVPNTMYYIRTYAINSIGTAYGNQVSLTIDTTIDNTNTVTDADGNIYKTVTIGSQTWMAVNLKTTRYNDFTAIPLETDNTDWHSISAPAYCWYNNDEVTHKKSYGALYNWYAVETGKLCPAGWHVPTDDEWKQLEIYLGISSSYTDSVGLRGINEGGKLKALGYYWRDHLEGTTNESGFSALPGGYRSGFHGGFQGNFELVGDFGCWWSSTERIKYNPYYRSLSHLNHGITRQSCGMKEGLSVRCLRD